MDHPKSRTSNQHENSPPSPVTSDRKQEESKHDDQGDSATEKPAE